MEQVADNHGSGILDIHTPGVAELVDPRRSRDFEPPRSFREFYRFPKECGWKVTEGYELEITQSSPRQLTLPLFIQAWLFFGLVQTIVQTDGTPVLSFDDLHKNENLSTARLHDAIEIWTKWEESHPEGQRFRMVRIGWVLDMARHVVQKMFAYGSARNDKVDDKDVLVIMCLGETLGAAKARIVEANKRIDMTGWHGDDFAGWGPPRWVFERMKEEEWCPRTMESMLYGFPRARSGTCWLIHPFRPFSFLFPYDYSCLSPCPSASARLFCFWGAHKVRGREPH